MAKLTRKTQKVFGESAGGTGITEYGSPAGGSPVYSTDPDDIQTADWLVGWSAAALAGSEIPTFQDFNGIHFVATRQIGYLLQEGIAEFDLDTEYHQNSIVKKTGTYELYGSIGNTNLGNALPSQVNDANWQYLGDLAALVTVGAQLPVGSVYMNASVATNPATLLGYGSWSALGVDRVLIGVGASNPVAGATGGSDTRSLSTANNAAHTHTVEEDNNSGSVLVNPAILQVGVSGGGIGFGATTSSGSGSAFSIVQSFEVVYMWKRTS